MRNYLMIFLVLVASVEGAFNPFFDTPSAPKKAPKSTLPLLPPPPVSSFASLHLPITQSPSATAISSILYFGYIEAEKGKFALIKIDQNNIVLKENNRVYLNSIPYFVREITSNAIVMEDSEKRVKSIYFSGDRTEERE